MPQDDRTTGGTDGRQQNQGQNQGQQPQGQQSQQQPQQQQASRGSGRRSVGSRLRDYLATTVVRFGLAAIGVVLLLFSLGQAFGVDLLGAFADALSTQTGQWLVVALFALFLIGAAERGLSHG
ncbi:hypothetical protein [Haloarchaeobius amylolyticus]|uniref:hypothetical protein n=1 Tax=Haloarchaeobius amylolyticus TaxID=1198296 RepID=UPI0022715ACE|nr:hypothetical protein [Haloarchaeobius amylolyticus]